MYSMSERQQLKFAEALAAQLHPPAAPSVCPGCLVVFSKLAITEGSVMKLLQIKCHAFWDAMIAFVAWDWTPQTKADISALLARAHLLCSKCRQAKCVGFENHKTPLADSWFGLVYQACCTCLRMCSQKQIGRSVKGLGSKHGRWPMTVDQLFPYGPEQTVASLVAQLDRFSLAEVIISILVVLQRQQTLRCLLRDENRCRLLASATARLTACMAAVTDDIARLQQPISAAAQEAIARRHIQLCEGLGRMLHDIALGPDSLPTDSKQFFSLYEQQLFLALHPLALLLHGVGQYFWLPTLASILWTCLSSAEREECCPEPPIYAAQRMTESFAGLSDPYHALRILLAKRYGPNGRRGCNGAGCSRNMDTFNGTLLKCGKCRFVQYCSRECQKADWKHAPFPHKEICDMLQELFTFSKLDATMDSDAFVDACRAHAFPLDRVDRLIAWATDGEAQSNFAGGANFCIEPQPDFVAEIVSLEEDRDVHST